MRKVAFLDTSILTEYLSVPGKSDQPERVRAELAALQKEGAVLILPIAAVIETGNHIAKCKADGRVKRQLAEDLSTLIQKTVRNEAPWTLGDRPLDEETLLDLAKALPGAVQQELGAGDLSILQAFLAYCELNRSDYVFIWSKDHHLAGYRRAPAIPTRRRLRSTRGGS